MFTITIMKTWIFILAVLAMSSCEEKGVRKHNDIYKEWEWKATLFLNGDIYRSASALDSTYYYDFKEDGILEIKDINKTIKYEEEFEIIESEQNRGTITYVNNSKLHCRYSIENNELKISNVEGFFVWINVYRPARQQESTD